MGGPAIRAVIGFGGRIRLEVDKMFFNQFLEPGIRLDQTHTDFLVSNVNKSKLVNVECLDGIWRPITLNLNPNIAKYTSKKKASFLFSKFFFNLLASDVLHLICLFLRCCLAPGELFCKILIFYLSKHGLYAFRIFD